MKTVSIKDNPLAKNWLVMDAEGQPLGRLASEVSRLLRGKHKPTFTPHIDGGDYVVVVNAEKIQLTGDKWDKKVYYRHSGYMGGLKSFKAKDLLQKKPEQLLELAVKGMLARNKMRSKLLKNLKVYVGPDHPHTAQNPQAPPPRLAPPSAQSTVSQVQEARAPLADESSTVAAGGGSKEIKEQPEKQASLAKSKSEDADQHPNTKESTSENPSSPSSQGPS